jgi:ATP-binding cassette subfamily B protein
MRIMLWRAVRAMPWSACAHVLCAIVAATTTLAQPAALAATVDAVTSGGPRTPLLLLTGIFVAGLGARVIAGWTSSLISITSTRDLRRGLARHALRLSTPQRQPFSVGDLVSRIGMDARMPGALLAMATELGLGAVISVLALVAVAVIDWPTAIVVVVGGAAMAAVARRFVVDLSGPVQQYQRHRGDLAARLLDACRGARTIRASGTLARELTRILVPLAGLRSAAAEQWRAQRHLVGRVTLLNYLLEVVIIGVAGWRLAAGALTPGQLLAVIAYANLALTMLEQVDLMGELVFVRSGVARVEEVLAHPPALAPAARPGARPTGPGALRFEQVGLRGQLDSVSLEIPGGTHLAVVGRSGAGKSALCALSGRLTDPDDGQVLLDGVRLPLVDPVHLRHRIAYAFERPELFGTTIGDAIAAGRPATAAQIAAAAAAGRAAHFIECLPRGYDTPVAELALSGGEIQRLGIARALLGDADVLILDDATSSLDTATEVELLDVLRTAWVGRTAILVAHRRATAATADAVIWLDEGRVRRVGTHHDLEADPEYRATFGPTLVEAAA